MSPAVGLRDACKMFCLRGMFITWTEGNSGNSNLDYDVSSHNNLSLSEMLLFLCSLQSEQLFGAPTLQAVVVQADHP
jgi:hypothetical protein